MLLAIAAYLTAITLAPLMLGLGQVATFPLTYVATRSRIKTLDVIDELIEGLIGGCGAIWLASLIFAYLGQTPHYSLLALYIGAGAPYYLHRIGRSSTPYQDISEMIGSAVGLLVGAYFFIPQLNSWANSAYAALVSI